MLGVDTSMLVLPVYKMPRVEFAYYSFLCFWWGELDSQFRCSSAKTFHRIHPMISYQGKGADYNLPNSQKGNPLYNQVDIVSTAFLMAASKAGLVTVTSHALSSDRITSCCAATSTQRGKSRSTMLERVHSEVFLTAAAAYWHVNLPPLR
jgi:hypothetical protein